MRDLVLDTAPTAELVTLDQAKAHLREDSDEFDDYIAACIAAAVGHLDGYSGVLGRALAEQTWVLHLDRFPIGPLRLPLPPLLAVESIAYIDTAGAAQTLSASVYKVLAGERATLELAYGQSWPATRAESRAVSITYSCGWEAPAGGAAWPAKLGPVIAAIKLMVGDLYAARETYVTGTIAAQIPMSSTVERLLRPLKVPRL